MGTDDGGLKFVAGLLDFRAVVALKFPAKYDIAIRGFRVKQC